MASRASDAVEQADEGILAEFGYKQELKRDWGLMHNFGISFSIIVRPCDSLPGGDKANVMIPVSHYWYNYPLRDWSSHGRTWCYVCGLDRRFVLHYPHRDQHGRDRLSHPNGRGTLLLGSHLSSC